MSSGAIAMKARPFVHGYELYLEKATLVYESGTCPLTVLHADGHTEQPALGSGVGEQLRHLHPIGVSSTHRTVPRRWSAHQCRAYDERWHMQGRWPNCALADSGEADR